MEGKKFDTAVPKESLHPDGGEMMYLLYSIQQKEGPWGYRYYVAQNSVMCKEEWYGNAKLEYVPVVCLNKVDGPVIVDSERELYSGEEVRLVR